MRFRFREERRIFLVVGKTFGRGRGQARWCGGDISGDGDSWPSWHRWLVEEHKFDEVLFENNR